MKHIAWLEDFLPKVSSRNCYVYVHENLEKENFSASLGVKTTQDLSAES